MSDIPSNYGSSPPRLFEYFAIVGLEQTNFALTAKSEIPVDAKDMGFRPIIKYAYNANQSVQQRGQTVHASSLSSNLLFLDDIVTDKEKSDSVKKKMTAQEMEGESEILMQMRKFCFPDLSEIIKRYLNLKANQKTQDQCYRILFQHQTQSEKFDFVLTKIGAQRMGGNVYCFIYFNFFLKQTNKKKKKILSQKKKKFVMIPNDNNKNKTNKQMVNALKCR
ncbi:hypothetical protein RFI_00979 [Reticulomyxa filosa]|uniref:Uncharacterized protein n=1 Tax=Reticulomyxa filosa TaxID=46433 RepID=X6PC42_RETFI|nr:hypothetical protein RFI_00979 [Reticulomyxa filosa]|eukprot:ETO36085.1 hypothetical protein RFI_00979 [Reticulomyxa filosa]